MNILSLLSHSSELLKIILKSNAPPDHIASLFLQKKKYIGSNDRKFISETVFATLRILYSCNYCAKKLNFQNIFENNKLTPKNPPELTLVVITCFLADKLLGDEIGFSPRQLLKFNYNSNSSFVEILTNAIYENYQFDKSKISEFVTSIFYVFKEVNSQILKITSDEHKYSFKNEINPKYLDLISIRYSISPYLLKKINLYNTKKDVHFLINFAKAFLQPAKVCLRTNSSIISRDKLLEFLNQNGYDAYQTPISPYGIYLEHRQQIVSTDVYKKGFCEIQDEGSQLIVPILDPQENSLILDACAGAGGKALHIADLTHNKAQIFAADIEYQKLKQTLIRAKRQGFTSIKTLIVPKSANHPSDLLKKYPKFPYKFDYVLVDVPCSGTGTARRSPLLKYNISEKKLSKLTKKQLEILNFYAQFVATEGILVYSTCSIIKDENQDIIEQFLNTHPNFQPSPILDILKKHNIYLPEVKKEDFMLNLFPSMHNTDGFFIARLKRIY